MGPDRDAGVVPTQLHGAVGGNGADGRPAAVAPLAISADGDPPTLPLPPVPAGPGPRPRPSRDGEPRRGERPSGPRRARPPRGLKRAIWATVVALILAIGALVATELHPWHPFNTRPANAASGVPHQTTTTVPSAKLEPLSNASYSASYDVTSQSFSVTVATDRPTWVEARAGATGPQIFAGELPAGATKQVQASGPLWVQVGAGGSTLTVEAEGKVIGTLRPALAPWAVTFTPMQSGG